ncbi:hypothetical protein [Leyella stercorea]|uniref:hypothetical protein n=1 Tax=Leyella stercorea TaxID=363265 RepID=UPI001F48B40D|nr:hypothetical protein [Leyella stercorea]MCF2614133.1 hypothetical protein [Leyella stercorea]
MMRFDVVMSPSHHLTTSPSNLTISPLHHLISPSHHLTTSPSNLTISTSHHLNITDIQ